MCAIAKCISFAPRGDETYYFIGRQTFAKYTGSNPPYQTICNLLKELCKEAQRTDSLLENQIGFHPIKLLRSLQKHRGDASLFSVLTYSFGTRQNPFLLPTTLSRVLQPADNTSPLGSFTTIPQKERASLLVTALLIAPDSAARERAARRVIAAGIDPNAVTTSAQHLFRDLPGHACKPKWRAMYRLELFDRIVELTPLAVAAVLQDYLLARTLINLAADPYVVCLSSSLNFIFECFLFSFVSS